MEWREFSYDARVDSVKTIVIVNSAGEKQICATLSDYTKDTEVPCKNVGNKIIVTRPGSGPNYALATAGLSILSNCECS